MLNYVIGPVGPAVTKELKVNVLRFIFSNNEGLYFKTFFKKKAPFRGYSYGQPGWVGWLA